MLCYTKPKVCGVEWNFHRLTISIHMWVAGAKRFKHPDERDASQMQNPLANLTPPKTKVPIESEQVIIPGFNTERLY